MDSLENIYRKNCVKYSDIYEHLPVLKKYTEECNHVTEMGVRYVVSTYAFMMGKPKRLISYDKIPVENFNIDRNDLKILAKDNGVEFDFYVGDTTKIEIEETDLLFIDTWHVYQQLIVELTKHGNKSKKYIIMHDTTTFGDVGECNEGDGLMKAINEFLEKNPHWVIHEKLENNNGLTILKRKKIDVNFIITIYDKESYWPYLKNILDNYTSIKSNYVVCYSGKDNSFPCDIKMENLINGGRGDDHHPHSCPYVDMDYLLTINGYDFLKSNNVNNWIKLSVDSWLVDENKVLDIINFLNKEECSYGGNIWYTHINFSTDIFFANTKKYNIFEDLKKHGNQFLDWLYFKKIPTGLENLMRYIVIPYDFAIIEDREPLSADGTRWMCPKLGWCMSHCLETNVNFLNEYVSDNLPVKLKKIKGTRIEYSFENYLKDSGQKIIKNL